MKSGMRGTNVRKSHRVRIAQAAVLAVALAVVLAACSGSTTSKPDPTTLVPSALTWCDQPEISFIDDASTSQSVITDWSQVSFQLSFVPYLPATFPKGTCLVLAGGTLHDPVLGSSLRITWYLPGAVPVSFSEAPKRADLGGKLQCTTSATDAKTAICLGALGNANITIASRQSVQAVQTLFKSLKPNVNWVPADTQKLLATPTASPGV